MSEAPAVPGVDRESLRSAVRKTYAALARARVPGAVQEGLASPIGARLARSLGYEQLLEGVPESAIARFTGSGNPYRLGALTAGENVVDVGCGAGMDALIAAGQVAPYGNVVGVDMTKAMLDEAEACRDEAGLTNVAFRTGYAEALPVENGWADVVMANGVLNLIPDKVAAMKEMARVLKPGGRLQLADVVVAKPVPAKAKERIDLWIASVAGALLEAELEALVSGCGFVGLEIPWRDDVFQSDPQHPPAAHGALGITFRATKR